MEKQHNRGQDGAGIAAVKLNTEPGYPFLHRIRSGAQHSIADVFSQIGKEIEEIEKSQPDIKQHPGLMKGHIKIFRESYCWGIYDMEHREKTMLIFAIRLLNEILYLQEILHWPATLTL